MIIVHFAKRPYDEDFSGEGLCGARTTSTPYTTWRWKSANKDVRKKLFVDWAKTSDDNHWTVCEVCLLLLFVEEP